MEVLVLQLTVNVGCLLSEVSVQDREVLYSSVSNS